MSNSTQQKLTFVNNKNGENLMTKLVNSLNRVPTIQELHNAALNKGIIAINKTSLDSLLNSKD